MEYPIIITACKVTPVAGSGLLRAYATVELNGQFRVSGLRLCESRYGLQLQYPNDPMDKEFHCVCEPLTKNFYQRMESVVINAYADALNNKED